MKINILIIALVGLAILLSSCSNEDCSDFITFNRIVNECGKGGMRTRDIIEDYKFMGLTGKECINKKPDFIIPKELIKNIEVSKNKSSYEGLNILNVSIDLKKHDGLIKFSSENINNKFTIFINDYDFGPVTMIGALSSEFVFTVVNRDIKEFYPHLKKVHSETKIIE